MKKLGILLIKDFFITFAVICEGDNYGNCKFHIDNIKFFNR